MTLDERTTQRSQRRSQAKAVRATDRKRRGGRVETESLYSKRSPASAARARAAGKAAKDRSSQADRVARGGVGSSTGARKSAAEKQRAENREPRTANRRSTKAKEVTREGLYDVNSPANRARERAAGKAAKDASNQAKRDVTSPEYKTEQERKKREAEEKKRQAQAKAKELEAKAKEAREKAEKLKGKEKRAARDEAEKLEAQAKVAREDAKASDTSTVAATSEKESLYSGTSKADKARTKAVTKQAAKQDHLYSSAPASQVSESAVSTSPASAPPVVTNSALALQAACTLQAWSQLESQVGLLS